MQSPREQRIELPHGAMTALAWGDPSSPPLLALHGWLDNAGSFARVAPLLADRYRLIALELPGHGGSDHLPPGASYHYLDYVRAVLRAVDALGLGRFTLLGHSLGAGVASLFAAARPDRIERLLLIEGLGPLGDDGSHTLQRFRDAFAPSKPTKPLRLFRSVEQAVAARSVVSGLPAELAQPIVERGLIEAEGGWRWRSDPRLTRPSPTRLAETQVRALLLGIVAPTALLLAEAATPYLPSDLMQARAACVANIAVSHLHGGHHLHLEQPAAVDAWVRTFTQENTAG
jgi:pimeloyl-ACP methyl ester carboxylesterase